jgi:hypothetical protein
MHVVQPILVPQVLPVLIYALFTQLSFFNKYFFEMEVSLDYGTDIKLVLLLSIIHKRQVTCVSLIIYRRLTRLDE